MPLIQQRVALLANGNTPNAFAGSQYEYLPFPALVEIGIVADATGVLATVSSGSDILAEEGPVQIGVINTQPRYPDDFHLVDEAAPGDRIKVGLRDTSGVARVVMVTARITPM